jgi:hypothetical protein
MRLLKLETASKYLNIDILEYQNIEILKYRGERGVAVLPLVIISSFIILVIGTAVAFVTFFENQTAFSARKAGEALAAAQAGVNDAMQKIVYNRSYSGSYDLAVNSASSTVTVTKNEDCAGAFMGKTFTVDSLGSVQNRQRKIRAVVSADCDSGQVTVVSIREIEI